MDGRKENQFWKLRSKHGRDKLFETPEILWEAATEYFEWCDNNPLMECQAKTVSNGNGAGSSVEMVQLPRLRAYTLMGLCLYLDCNEAYFRQFKDNEKKDFSTVLERIEKTIYTQKFTGAAADLFNANIIARDLGLKDRSDMTSNDEKITLPEIDLSQLTDAELDQYERLIEKSSRKSKG